MTRYSKDVLGFILNQWTQHAKTDRPSAAINVLLDVRNELEKSGYPTFEVDLSLRQLAGRGRLEPGEFSDHLISIHQGISSWVQTEQEIATARSSFQR